MRFLENLVLIVVVIRYLFTKKSWKLSKSGKSKSKESAKSQNLSKSVILFKFNTKEIGLSLLISNAKEVFNYLWLILIKALIF